MRQIRAALLVSAAVSVLSGLPVISFPATAATPVGPRVAHVPLVGVSRAAAAPQRVAPSPPAGDHEVLALSSPRRTDDFKLLGVTWRGSGADADPEVWVRTRTGGAWSGWQALHYDDEHAPDPGTAEAKRARDGTAPLWVGASDGVEVRVDTADGVALEDLRADLVDPGTSAADAHPEPAAPAASASAAASQPTIYTREQWGADESLRNGFAGYGSTIEVGFVHHTVNANNYSAADVPALIRGIYAYHVKSNGWSDIGYNFLVDKFGRLWEGRYGGISLPVIGAHTAPYNTDSFAVSAIGNFETASAPSAMTNAISQLMAWKLGLYGRDPLGTTTLNGHSFRVISGHRDAKATACPGQYLYAKLPAIRTQTKSLMGPTGAANATSDSGRSH